MDKLPPFSHDLIKELSKLFPDSYAIPKPLSLERDIWIRVGERRIVAMLENLLETSTSSNPAEKILPKLGE